MFQLDRARIESDLAKATAFLKRCQKRALQNREFNENISNNSQKRLTTDSKKATIKLTDNIINEDEFKESEHPRDENGRFTSGGGSSGSKGSESKTSEQTESAESSNSSASSASSETATIGTFGGKTTGEFCDSIKIAKSSRPASDSWRVSGPSAKDFDSWHPNATKHITEGGSTVAVAQDGDIVGVCKSKAIQFLAEHCLKWQYRTVARNLMPSLDFMASILNVGLNPYRGVSLTKVKRRVTGILKETNVSLLYFTGTRARGVQSHLTTSSQEFLQA